MAICPECEEELDIDNLDVEEGDVISCDQCGSTLRVVGTSPLELEAYDEDDEDEDDDFDEEDEDGGEEEDDEDEEDEEDWEE